MTKTESISTQIENISDTARWVAVYRAMETERPDAIFRDPYAARLAGDRGRAIVDAMQRGRAMAWAMIVRTAVFDEIILDRVRNGGCDTVLNLAAGLDARAWRMNLPASLRWIDVDLPEILGYKTGTLKSETPVCQYEAIHVDLTDEAKRQALFTQVGAQSSRVLVVTEGLLVYLTPDQVGSLARDLHAPSSFRWWLIDLASPRLLAMMQRMWGRNLNAGNAPFQFAPAEGTQFFDKLGWEETEFRSSMEEAHRLKREMGMMWFWRFLGRMRSQAVQQEFRRMSGNVLLKRF
jgi:methyltransferase (TIGR00027 family)